MSCRVELPPFRSYSYSPIDYTQKTAEFCITISHPSIEPNSHACVHVAYASSFEKECNSTTHIEYTTSHIRERI